MRGRLTLETVNALQDMMYNFTVKKYTFLKKTHKSEIQIKKQKEYEAQETPELQGYYFFCENDLRGLEFENKKKFKMDNTGRQALQVLCHLGRLKVTGGVVKKYILL